MDLALGCQRLHQIIMGMNGIDMVIKGAFRYTVRNYRKCVHNVNANDNGNIGSFALAA